MKKDVLFKKKRDGGVCLLLQRGDKREAWLLIFMLFNPGRKGTPSDQIHQY